MSKYPNITTGLGVYTPDIWARQMKMLQWFEDNNVDGHDLQSLHKRLLFLENRREWFFAKLLRAHVLDEDLQNPNVYEYAWVRVFPSTGEPECSAECLATRGYGPVVCCNAWDETVALQGFFQWEEDLTKTSWGTNVPEAWTTDDYDSDNPLSQPCVPECGCGNAICHTEPYTAPALNIMEAFNTSHNAAPGTDETKGIGDFMMQAVGGGDTVLEYLIDGVCGEEGEPFEPCTQYEFPLWTTPIVIMWAARESDGTERYLFQAENAYDGTCADCTP